jgi:hypothetical protein
MFWRPRAFTAIQPNAKATTLNASHGKSNATPTMDKEITALSAKFIIWDAQDHWLKCLDFADGH